MNHGNHLVGHVRRPASYLLLCIACTPLVKMSATDFGNADFVFTDTELTELLGVIEQKATGDGGELDVLDFFQSDANQPLALQVWLLNFGPVSHETPWEHRLSNRCADSELAS